MTGRCKLDENLNVERNQLLEHGFYHALLTSKIITVSAQIFNYEYDDIDDLLLSARYVYSTLLNADNPTACKFKISPSAIFEYPDDDIESIYFSIKSHQAAEDFISLQQLEAIISRLNPYKFNFLQGIMINEVFTCEDLPPAVDGDILYRADEKFIELLKKPIDLDRYELRYINPEMGLGVFSREVIKKGELLFYYGGVKKISEKSMDVRYAFSQRLDCLNMHIDAREHGNLARFINHAPNPDENNPDSRRFLVANLNTHAHAIYGIEIIVFLANRDIVIGEQLLVDYGTKYFNSDFITRFKPDGKVVSENIFGLNSKKKLNQIKIMAGEGVRQAQQHLLLRLCIITGLIVLLMISLEVIV